MITRRVIRTSLATATEAVGEEDDKFAASEEDEVRGAKLTGTAGADGAAVFDGESMETESKSLMNYLGKQFKKRTKAFANLKAASRKIARVLVGF